MITVYADNGFYFINLSTKLFNDIEKRYPEIFNLQNGSLYWNEKKDNKRTCVKFWELISARDSNLPEDKKKDNELSDIQKELEAKFDELFGPIDDDEE